MSLESPDIALPKVSCDNCIGACCRAGSGLTLTHDEAYRNRRQMDLRAVVKPKPMPQVMTIQSEHIDESGRRVPVPTQIRLPHYYGFYILQADCGHLTEDNRCDIYETRPRACREYEVGSTACLDARAVFGLDGHEAHQQPGTPVEIRRN